MTKRYLFILNEFPVPRNSSGITLIDYEILTRSSGKCIIDLVILNKMVDNELIKELRLLFPAVDKISFEHNAGFKNLLNVLSRAYLNFSIFKGLNFMGDIDDYISKYNAIYISPMLANLDISKLKKPILLNAVDSFSKFNFREFNRNKKFRSYFKFVTYLRYEKFLLKNVNLLNLVSSDDMSFMSKRHIENTHKIININIGVDSGIFSKSTNLSYQTDEKFRVLFVGNFDYQPNADAARYLCNEIYPRVREIDHDIEVVLVGKNPPSDIIMAPGITATGFVDDVTDYYSTSSVFICPLRFGAGVKNKVLEAMSTGLPIISSEVGVEGILGLENNLNFLLADSTDSYVEALIKLKNNKAYAAQLGINALELISDIYDWESISQRYLNALNDMS